MATPVILSIRFVDGNGDVMSVPFRFDSATMNLVAEANAAFETLIPLLRAGSAGNRVSNCGILEAFVTFPVAYPIGLIGDKVPDAGSRVDQGATLSFENASLVAESLYIPGVSNTYVQDKRVVNTGDMAALTAALVTGVAGTGGPFPVVDKNGIDLISFRRGIQSTRKI